MTQLEAKQKENKTQNDNKNKFKAILMWVNDSYVSDVWSEESFVFWGILIRW